MYKLFKFFLLLFAFTQILIAKEPFLAVLTNVVSNDIQEFSYSTTRFSCLPYGVLAIDEIYRKAKAGSTCKKSIKNFYKKRKDLAYYISVKMKVYQSYPIKFKKNNRCIINLAGEKSLSEFLIEKGLAVRKPLFKDKEYSYYFYRAEKKAKANKKGIWKENTTKDCVAYIYTQEQFEQK